MLDSLSKTMSRSSGLMSNLREKASTTISSSSSLGSSSFSNGHAHAHKTFHAHVVFLDARDDAAAHVFEVDKKAKGAVLLDMVFAHLELHERDFFGLLFNDTGGVLPTGHSPDVMRWLDPAKPIRKQMRSLGSGTVSRIAKPGGLGMPPILYFRVKFYVTDPSRLQEEYTRYHLYLQVKRDLVEGRLTAPLSTICLLTSYAAQSTLGDYDVDTHKGDYLQAFRDLRKHCVHNSSNEEIERRITELHKLHKGQSPAEAEFNFLDHAKRLEMYGISLHNGKDPNGKDIQLGVTSIGLVVFTNNLKLNTFSWSKIVKISFKRKQFSIQLRKELSENYDTLLGFNLASYRSCKNLWKSAVEHHSFFRLHSPKAPPRKSLLTLTRAKFRYSGRTDFQSSPYGAQQHNKTNTLNSVRSAPAFGRSTPSRKTLPVTLDNGGGKAPLPPPPRLASPETSSIGSSVHSNGKHKPSAPSLVTIIKDGNHSGSNSSTSLAHRAIESFNHRVQSLSTKLPKKAWQEESVVNGKRTGKGLSDDEEGGFLDNSRRISSLGRLSSLNTSFSSSPNKYGNGSGPPASLAGNGSGTLPNQATFSLNLNNSQTSTPSKAKFNGQQQHPHQPSGYQPIQPLLPSALPSAVSRLPFADESSTSGQSGVSSTLITPTSLHPPGQPPLSLLAPPSKHSAHNKDALSNKSGSSGSTISNGHNSSLSTVPIRSLAIATPTASLATPSRGAESVVDGLGVAGMGEAEVESNGGLVTITILPDEKGRFGFNVKGGADQKMPIIVSRVGTNTPADKCFPKLNEGDQVVFINGRDVSGHSHEQVVNFIRASSEPHSGQLILAVKQNVYIGEDVEEPEFQYVPETNLPLNKATNNVLDIPGRESQHMATSGTKLTASNSASNLLAGLHINPQQSDPLSQSLLLLEESLDSGAILGQFEQLYRRNPAMLMSVCHAAENVTKNRYRDISPYDSTRYRLSTCPSGDYINGNHVDMTIPGSGIVNRYLATQGPLASTCMDFWYMTWESQSDLIIMLTTIVERGRVKCHKYWPDVGEQLLFEGGLGVKCTREDEKESFAFRDFELTFRRKKGTKISKKTERRKKVETKTPGSGEESSDSEASVTKSDHEKSESGAEDEAKEEVSEEDNSDEPEKKEKEEDSEYEEIVIEIEEDEYETEVRHITQMAYLSWPDHGVPEVPDEFVSFVEEVRSRRQGSICPTVVHCSAGIGRTGVLILMETALCLIEANQAVFPLDLTRQMRDQRASMIQTPAQYRFVCEAILKAFKEGRVKPLPEFSQA